MADQEYTDLKVDVGVLKTQIFTLSQLCEKMDKVIEKLVDVHDQHISKVYDTMDRNRKEKDEDIAEVHERVDVVSTTGSTECLRDFPRAGERVRGILDAIHGSRHSLDPVAIAQDNEHHA